MRLTKSFVFLPFMVTIAIGFFSWLPATWGNPISLTTDDSGGSSSQASFTTAGNWSNGSAPSAGNAYAVSGHTLRTPNDAGSYTFAGDSLTISGGGYLKDKSTGGGTITVSNLILDNAIVVNGCANATWTLAGNINLGSGGGYLMQSDTNDGGRVTIVTAAISGSGLLTVSGVAGTAAINCVKLANTNTYTGGTSLLSGASLYAEKDSVFGTGNVTVSGSLTLENGSSNNYIADTASLIVTSTGYVALNYSGTDVISGLTVNGATYTALGTYGASGSGATYTLSGFSGTGTLTLVPEPATTVMMVSGVAGLLAFAWRRRKTNKGR